MAAEKLVFNPKTLYDYQVRLFEEAIEWLPTKEVLLAAATGVGKTTVADAIIRHYLATDPTSRILVLAHNQTVLRDNFQQGIELPSFEFTKGSDVHLEEFKTAQVVVAIPSTIHELSKKALGSFTLIITDEAHQFYGKTMHSKIMKMYPKAAKLLLTASHGSFDSSKIHKIYFSVMEGLDAGTLEPISIELMETNQNFSEKDYSAKTDELKQGVKVDGMDEVFKSLWNRLNSYTGKMSKIYNVSRVLPFNSGPTPKTMIACTNVEQADLMYELYRREIGDRVVVSYAPSTGTEYKGKYPDLTSKGLTAFKMNSETRVLIVVNRGVVGYDVPELEYFVDLTGSLNVDRIMQMQGRAMRIHPDGKSKIFLKIMPERLGYIAECTLAACAALCHTEFYRKYTGNYKTDDLVIIPVIDGAGGKPVREPKPPVTTTPGPKPIRIPKFILEFAEWRDVFEQLKGKGNELLQGKCFTSISKIKLRQNGRDSESKKLAIIEFCREHSRRPSRKAKSIEERSLANVLNNYCSESGSSYDPEFRKLMNQVLPFDTVASNKSSILEFCNAYKTKPSQHIGSAEEIRLGALMSQYVAPGGKQFDSEFKRKIDKLFPPTKDVRELLEAKFYSKGLMPRGKFLTAHYNFRSSESPWLRAMMDKYPEAFDGKLGKSYRRMLSLMPSNVTFKEGQSWKGTKHSYTFIDSERGEFVRAPGTVFISWAKGLSGHPKAGQETSAVSKRRSVKNLDTNETHPSVSIAERKHTTVSKGKLSEAIKKGTRYKGATWAYCDENGNVITD